MFDSVVLDVAIGLIFVYMFSSLTRSAINKIMTFYKEAPPAHTYQVLRCCFLLTFVFLAGCASVRGFPKATYNENDEIKALAEYHAPAKIAEYVNAPNDNVKKSIRDNFVLARMRAMDIRFDQFLMALRQDNIPSKIGVAWAITGVTY